MTKIHAVQIQLTKMHVRKTKKVLYTVFNIFSHHIAHTFLPQSFDFHHFTTHYKSFPVHPAFTPSLRCTSLHFPSLHYIFLHFQMIFTSLHFTSLHFLSLHFSMIFLSLYFSLTHLNNRFPYPLFQGLQFIQLLLQ